MSEQNPTAAPIFDFPTLQLAGKSVPFDIPQIGAGARLFVMPTNEANKPYHRAMLSNNARRARHEAANEAGPMAQAESAKLDREDDRALFPGTIVVGWEGVRNTAGELVPFSVDAVRALLAALPNWLFDKLRLFCVRPENFTTAVAPVPSAEQVAKN